MAHLAGIPKEVVRAARKQLAELEKQLRPGAGTPDLFSAAQEGGTPPVQPNPLAEALRDIKPDELTPREALEALYRLRKIADEED